jgi:hypothetical protein
MVMVYFVLSLHMFGEPEINNVTRHWGYICSHLSHAFPSLCLPSWCTICEHKCRRNKVRPSCCNSSNLLSPRVYQEDTKPSCRPLA